MIVALSVLALLVGLILLACYAWANFGPWSFWLGVALTSGGGLGAMILVVATVALLRSGG